MIGAGPAGIACAVQCRRHGLRVRLLDGSGPGGLIRLALRIENLPMVHGLTGPQVCEAMRGALDAHGITVEPARVDRLERLGDLFLSSGEGFALESRAVVLATGTIPRTSADLPGAAYLTPTFRFEGYAGKSVAVVGGGDLAFDVSQSLRRVGARPFIFVRGKARPVQPLREAAERSGIDVVEGCGRIRAVSGPGGGILIWKAADGRAAGPFDALIGAIGREPADALAVGMGASLADRLCGRTDVRGLYMVGDLVLGGRRQSSLAMGTGVAAAMDIGDLLEGSHG